MNDIVNDIKIFMEAQQTAEEHGEQEFTCPLCGKSAIWGRSDYNNHLHCVCRGCGFTMME